jgi:hypothetical protein
MLKKMNSSILLEFWNSLKPLICLLENVENIIDEKYALLLLIGINNLNKIELVDKISATLTQLLKESRSPCSLSNCANIARKYELIIDEDQRDCQETEEEQTILLISLKR